MRVSGVLRSGRLQARTSGLRLEFESNCCRRTAKQSVLATRSWWGEVSRGFSRVACFLHQRRLESWDDRDFEK